MRITIETIPHASQKYPTCGDWRYAPDGTLEIKVSDLGDEFKETLIAVHELIEVQLLKQRGIGAVQVDSFDVAFEAARPKDNTDEPGDDPSAPYKREHCIATGVERILAAEFGIDWKLYEQQIDALVHPMDAHHD